MLLPKPFAQCTARGAGVRIKADASPVTEADMRAEEAIRAILRARFPTFGFYGEETGKHEMVLRTYGSLIRSTLHQVFHSRLPVLLDLDCALARRP